MNAEANSHFPAISWQPRDVLLAILVAAGGLLLLNLITLGLNALLDNALRESSSAISFFLIAQAALLMATVWLFSVGRYRARWAELGLREFSLPSGCALSAGLFLASYIARACYVLFAFALGIRLGMQPVLTRLDIQGPGFVLTLLVGAIIAPIAEEIFFRGFVYGGLRARLGVARALFTTSLFFAFLHLSLEFFIPILVLGTILTLLYEMTGSLYPGILLHAANNVIALVAYYLVHSFNIPLELSSFAKCLV